MIKVNEFLSTFHGESKIHFRVIKKGDKPHNLYGTYDELNVKLRKYNEDGYDVYFVVNSGGTHNYEINKINAVYIDFDCGKDKSNNNQYYSLDVVQKFKDECIKKVDSFKFKPSHIVETRNGIHVYWAVENGTVEQFEQCQEQLINYFDSDQAVKTVERIMRLPDFYWTKDINNKFLSSVIATNKVKYDILDIINSLPEVKSEDVFVKRNKIKNDSPKQSDIPFKSSINNIIQIKEGLVRYNGAEVLQKIIMANRLKLNIINTLIGEGVLGVPDRDNNKTIVSTKDPKNPYLMEETCVSSHNEVYDFLKKQSLNEYLGVEGNQICCLFHDDKRPSASIFQDPSTGYWWYKCHSAECQLNKVYTKANGTTSCTVNIMAKDIIALTERLLKTSRPKALRFLRKVYHVNFQETDWQKEQKEILDENVRMLTTNFQDLEKCYPTLFKRLKQNKHHLIELILFAKEHVYTENFSDKDNNAVFFASMKRLIELFGLSEHTSGSKISGKIAIFAFLGVLFKLKESDIPQDYLKTAKHLAAKNKQVNIVGFYSIPSYTDEVLAYAEEMSKLFIEKNMSMKGLTRELLIRTFGVEFADEIFPQLTPRKKASEKSNDMTAQIHKITLELINEKHYAVEKEILEGMKVLYLQMGVGYSDDRLITQIKKSLQEMLDAYGFERIRLNKELKKKYGVAENGYPFIVVQK